MGLDSTLPPRSFSAPSPASSPPLPSPTPVQSIGADVRWERISTVTDAPDLNGNWRVLRGFQGGYAAIARSPAAVWSSADGITWTETRLRVPRGAALGAEAIAGAGDTILVGGSYSPCSLRAYERNPFGDCRPRPVSWASSDGRDWRASPPWQGPIGERGRSGSLFNEVWSVPTGGWDAAQAFDPSDESDGFELVGSAIWHSTDGLAWKLLKDYAGEDLDCPSDLAAGEFRAVRMRPDGG